MSRNVLYIAISASLTSLVVASLPAAAQLATEEIIVTARKREETSLSTPVILSAIGSGELQRRAINSFDILARAVPQLMVGDAAGGVQGGTIGIRGVSAGEQNPFIDQAVSFNIDGAQLAVASPRRMGQMDIEHIEVLKGPQALFFGKDSPAGIVSIRTADPTEHFEAKASVGYEVVAHEVRGEGYVSGPITDTIGIRIAAYGSGMRGWVKNIAPLNPPYGPAHTWGPGTQEYTGRLTLTFKPSDKFDVRFKVSYANERDHGSAGISEIYFCPLGHTQNPNSGDCLLNHTVARGDFGTLATKLQPEYGDGVPGVWQHQSLSSLEMNYKPTDHLKLTSLTTYFQQGLNDRDSYTLTASPTLELMNSSDLPLQQIGQEVRLATSYDFPVNATVGGFYEHTHVGYFSHSAFNSIVPAVTRYDEIWQYGNSYSAFGQLVWNITSQLELSGGGRYSHEHKSIRASRNGVDQVVFDPARSWNNFSPEAILTWRPSSKITVFGGYKRGFLSGGFNSGSGNFNISRAYNQEIVKGFEGGAKALIFNDTLRMNFGAYDYKLTGLQVSTLVAFPALHTTSQIVTNAGASKLYGFDYDVTWETPAEGLVLNGALGYNHARYQTFVTTCYPGQTQALGCNLLPNPSGTGNVIAASAQTATLQSLAGLPLVRAPDWNLTLGASYEHPLTSKLNLGLSANTAYSSQFFGDATGNPAGIMPSYWLFDATVRIFAPDEGWEFAIIGNNLTDKIYYTRASPVPFTGGGQGTNVGVLADEYSTPARGREVMFRISKKID